LYQQANHQEKHDFFKKETLGKAKKKSNIKKEGKRV